MKFKVIFKTDINRTEIIEALTVAGAKKIVCLKYYVTEIISVELL